MVPTLIPGDRVLVVRGLGPFRPPLRVGDLVALTDPRDRRPRRRGGVLPRQRLPRGRGGVPRQRLPRGRGGVPRQRLMVKRVAGLTGGEVVVLGDNAAASTDSRHFGPLTSDDVQGRVVYRYYPENRRGRLS